MDDQPSCSSPRPMAFTVDFGDHTEEADKKKKLALRDSIGRFAPAKIKNKLPLPSTAAAGSSAAVGSISKDNSNCKTVTDQEVILDEENNIAHKKQTVESAGGLLADVGRPSL